MGRRSVYYSRDVCWVGLKEVSRVKKYGTGEAVAFYDYSLAIFIIPAHCIATFIHKIHSGNVMAIYFFHNHQLFSSSPSS